jgi:hypothetical protein
MSRGVLISEGREKAFLARLMAAAEEWAECPLGKQLIDVVTSWQGHLTKKHMDDPNSQESILVDELDLGPFCW